MLLNPLQQNPGFFSPPLTSCSYFSFQMRWPNFCDKNKLITHTVTVDEFKLRKFTSLKSEKEMVWGICPNENCELFYILEWSWIEFIGEPSPFLISRVNARLPLDPRQCVCSWADVIFCFTFEWTCITHMQGRRVHATLPLSVVCVCVCVHWPHSMPLCSRE